MVQYLQDKSNRCSVWGEIFLKEEEKEAIEKMLGADIDKEALKRELEKK